ncbi:MAG: hypothetical protein JXR76_19470 [Deltaproteobacteria bacterium]|nr:hypothetical protein [Deltaproteobacteria bacterium]
MKHNLYLILMGMMCIGLWAIGAVAQERAADAAPADASDDTTGVSVAAEGQSELELKAEIARAEAEKAKAEAEKAKAEAELAQTKAEAEKAKAEAEKAKAEADAEAQKANAQTNASMTASSAPVVETPLYNTDDARYDDQPNHRGFYMRFTPGLGVGTVWANGTMDPMPGVERINDPFHSTVTGTMGLDLGAGIVRNLALHVGAFIEKMILRDQHPTKMAFSIFGVDAGLSWYFTDLELFLTGQFRWVGMLIKTPAVSCTDYFRDKYGWYKGPGASLTIGREWFENARDQGAAGIGLQANYYRVYGGIRDHFAFNHFSLLLVLTFTRF